MFNKSSQGRKYIFSILISLEEDVSSGDCPLGRMLSELKYPWKKESFQRHWGHNIIARKAKMLQTQNTSMKEDDKIGHRNRKIPTVLQKYVKEIMSCHNGRSKKLILGFIRDMLHSWILTEKIFKTSKALLLKIYIYFLLGICEESFDLFINNSGQTRKKKNYFTKKEERSMSALVREPTYKFDLINNCWVLTFEK